MDLMQRIVVVPAPADTAKDTGKHSTCSLHPSTADPGTQTLFSAGADARWPYETCTLPHPRTGAIPNVHPGSQLHTSHSVHSSAGEAVAWLTHAHSLLEVNEHRPSHAAWFAGNSVCSGLCGSMHMSSSAPPGTRASQSMLCRWGPVPVHSSGPTLPAPACAGGQLPTGSPRVLTASTCAQSIGTSHDLRAGFRWHVPQCRRPAPGEALGPQQAIALPGPLHRHLHACRSATLPCAQHWALIQPPVCGACATARRPAEKPSFASTRLGCAGLPMAAVM